MSDKTGYKNPPLATRFRPGQSGNPRGRPPGRRSFRAELEKLLQTEVETADGIRSLQHVFLESVMKGALAGDPRKFQALVGMCAKLLADQSRAEPEIEITAEDTEILDQHAGEPTEAQEVGTTSVAGAEDDDQA